MTVEIRRADPRRFAAFLQASDDYAASLYPAESNHLLGVEALLLPEIVFFGVFVEGKAAGCGAYKACNGYAEIKRVWVDPAMRGLGLSRALMAHIETEAHTKGFQILRLETGVSQPEALGLYRALGYVERAPFGEYKPDPLSVFMEKRLSNL